MKLFIYEVIYEGSKFEINQISINWWMDKQIMVW